MTQAAPTPNGSRNERGLLDRLKEYKEIIVVAAFFLSGVSWIYASFETKQHVRELSCRLQADIDIATLNVRSGILMRQLDDVGQRLKEIADGLEGANDLALAENARLAYSSVSAREARELKKLHHLQVRIRGGLVGIQEDIMTTRERSKRCSPEDDTGLLAIP